MSSTTITINGPFWSAQARVLRGSEAEGGSDLTAYTRTVFADARPLFDPQRPDGLYKPGTLIALCAVEAVTVRPHAENYRFHAREDADFAANTADEIRSGLQRGDLSLLLLETSPASPGDPACTLLNGRIALHAMDATDDTLDALYANLAITPPGGDGISLLEADASGLTLRGGVHLPWEGERALSLALRVSPVYDADAEPELQGRHGIVMQLAPDRFRAGEADGLAASWRAFSRYLNPPHPRNRSLSDDPYPQWVTLEIDDPNAVPELMWTASAWGSAPMLSVDLQQVNLLLSDRKPYDTQIPPSSLARLQPDSITVTRDDDGLILITALCNSDGHPSPDAITYLWTRRDRAEQVVLPRMEVAYSPVETPAFLRRSQELPQPTWEPGGPPIAQPLLWGFMPLEDGWAQLPVLNLTEQVYLDADLPDTGNAALPAVVHSVMQGALSIGNDRTISASADDPARFERRGEQPWRVTVASVDEAIGVWTLAPNAPPDAAPEHPAEDDAGYHLAQVELAMVAPDLVLEGLLWLSTGRPTVEDALPDLRDWTDGLHTVPLRTHGPDDDLFPPVLTFILQDIAFARADTNPDSPAPDPLVRPDAVLVPVQHPAEEGVNGDNPPVPDVRGWSFQYGIGNEMKVLRDFKAAGVLPEDIEGRIDVLVWLRHPSLPVIQALPLTQNRTPPNTPSASRQLAPYVMHGLATAWRFGVGEGSGAAQWTRPLDPVEPAPLWRDLHDLPLVALSLPGLLLDPHPPNATHADALATGPQKRLYAHLRHDLPYLDQINALARVPSSQPDPDTARLLPPDAPQERPAPLTPETYAGWWRALSERASLAAADAVDALATGEDGATGVAHLVEPFLWAVQPAAALDDYPGALTLTEPAGTTYTLTAHGDPLDPTTLDALRGLYGDFLVAGDHLRRLAPGEAVPDGETPFRLEAGSLYAHTNGDGVYRDQRGLMRRASLLANGATVPALIRTRVALDTGEVAGRGPYDLTSLLAPLRLIAGADAWLFWFRDLPVSVGTPDRPATAFDRAVTRSAVARERDLDINDPEVASTTYDVLTAYEWRLGTANAPVPESGAPPRLSLYGLDFYPLTLETVTLQGDSVIALAVIGRLQLPLPGRAELDDFANAVRLTFTTDDGALMLSAVQAVSAPGVWPLALDDGEAGDRPRLVWEELELRPRTETTMPGIAVTNGRIEFFLFGELWQVHISDLRGPYAGTLAEPAAAADLELAGALLFDGSAIRSYAAMLAPALDDAPPLTPYLLELALEMFTGQHRATFTVRAEIDPVPALVDGGGVPPAQPALTTLLAYDLITGTTRAGQTQLFGGRLHVTDAAGSVTQRAVQLDWRGFSTPQPTVDLLPGMGLTLFEELIEDARPGDENAALFSGEAPGYAVLSFTVKPDPVAGNPRLVLTGGSMELLLTCGWGDFLQEGGQLSQARLFGASAGDVVAGYTAEWHSAEGEWQRRLLLNGLVEVKNLISWPLLSEMLEDQQGTALMLPGLDDNLMDHTRHTIRVLLNQHEVPQTGIVAGTSLARLYDFAPDAPWQFLAVVEHQLIDVLEEEDASAPASGATVLNAANDRRWTALQEVRLIPPPAFDAFLSDQDGTAVYDPVSRAARQIDAGWHAETERQNIGRDHEHLDFAFDVSEFVTGGKRKYYLNEYVLSLGSRGSETSYTGMHFPDVDIPRGAKVIRAYLEVVVTPDWAIQKWVGADARQGGPEGIDVRIHAHKAASSPNFEEDTPPSERLLTEAFVQHDPHATEWRSGKFTQLDNLAPVVQEIVDQEGWQGGNGISFVFVAPPAPDGQPTANRYFYAGDIARVEGQTANRPRLVVEYTAPGVNVQGYLDPAWRQHYQMTFGEVAAADQPGLQDGVLMVEASAPHWIRQQPLGPTSATTLQYLPEGNQLAYLSAPDDFASPDDPITGEADGWLLLVMPFLGRLQPADLDDPALPTADPVAHLDTLLDVPDPVIPPLLLSFVNRGDADPVRLPISPFDGYAGRWWPRLDASTLEENWFRVQHPPDESFAPGDGLRGVMAAYPDTPARLSRSRALRRAFDGFRRSYPPALHTGAEVPEPVSDEHIVWRRSSFMVMQALANTNMTDAPAYTWHIPGWQLAGSALGASYAGPEPARFPAATLLPALLESAAGDPNPQPVSFAVSPYLGLDYVRATAPDETLLISAELLAIDRATGRLMPVASRLFEPHKDSNGLPVDLDALTQYWGQQIHARLNPESPVAVLRNRVISRSGDILTADYRLHVLADIVPVTMLTRRLFAMRATVRDLRYRQAQYGGTLMPDTASGELRGFELAPPQTTGAQPLYITEPVDPASTNGANGSEVPAEGDVWPWGLSALRMSVRYTGGTNGVSEGVAAPLPAADGAGRVLWWGSLRQAMQYRSALTANGQPAASLPRAFRAPAIRSLLSVLPDAPLPAVPVALLPGEGGSSDDERWQAILPGMLHYLLTGARPGAMFGLRHGLLRQTSLSASDRRGQGVVSGSVPVQHRAPRPVPLPPNRFDRRGIALQTWASYFEPLDLLAIDTTPHDQSFRADRLKDDGSIDPANRVFMRLLEPAGGLIPAGWNGDLRFAIQPSNTHGSLDLDADFALDLRVSFPGGEIAYTRATAPEADGSYRFSLVREPDVDGLVPSATTVAGRITGAPLVVQADVQYLPPDDNFAQRLSFPLRRADGDRIRLPLEPFFIQFEDPEYNRRLASSAAHAELPVKLPDNGQTVMRGFKISADRRQYNPHSTVAFRFDWMEGPGGPDPASGYTVTLQVIRGGGEVLTLGTLDALLPGVQVAPGKLFQVALPPEAVLPGQTLQIRVDVAVEFPQQAGGALTEQTPVFLQVDVVAEPVTPAPEAGYALLRSQMFNGRAWVECVRFAWSPAATRVELVEPSDLLAETVRRRAVFQWDDTVRPGRLMDVPSRHYAVQKLAMNGATHVPHLRLIDAPGAD